MIPREGEDVRVVDGGEILGRGSVVWVSRRGRLFWRDGTTDALRCRTIERFDRQPAPSGTWDASVR